MPLKGYDPHPIAQEIINIFAKYEIPINFKDIVYKTVDEMLSFQTVVPVEVTVRATITQKLAEEERFLRGYNPQYDEIKGEVLGLVEKYKLTPIQAAELFTHQLKIFRVERECIKYQR